MKNRKEDAGELAKGTPVESQDQTSAQWSSPPLESHDQSPPSTASRIFRDERGEALGPRTVVPPAVLLKSDNSTTLQNNSTRVQAPSAASSKPSLSRQVIETPMPEPMVVSSPSNGYPVFFMDQARTVLETPVPEPMVVPSSSNGYPVQFKDQAPKRRVALDP